MITRWNDPLFVSQPWRFWARSISASDAHISWHEPSAEEMLFVEQLIDEFLVHPMQKLQVIFQLYKRRRRNHIFVIILCY